MNLGTNVMKLAINKRTAADSGSRGRLVADPLWLAGFTGYVVGTVMNFGAFRFAAQSLLSGLSSIQFISQLFFSKLILDEAVPRAAFIGVLCIISGCIFVVIFGKHETRIFTPDELAALYGRPQYVSYILGAAFLSIVVWVAYKMRKKAVLVRSGNDSFDMQLVDVRERQFLALLYSFRSGIVGSQAVLLAKSISMLLSQVFHPKPDQSSPLTHYLTYFILLGFVAAALYWMIRLNSGLRLFDALYLIPMMQVSWIAFSTVSGGIYYEEFTDWGAKEVIAYTLGFIQVLVGVALLCPKEKKDRAIPSEVFYELVEGDIVGTDITDVHMDSARQRDSDEYN
eukprot:CAMPEP_0198728312 /NCGR_PEP_ID=MMETSP1475-20131203/8281_1 /TAXON_ID= ORGANISM="Unidentified sp., Strain CCMP1999" /NCGR_SAMPLE_ID=MMETSP1475 /ASSEMBLY_ACC=CAM_ASM_001111 /LENGTH=339 /DNA_ID=CAMNT_0044490633 /DNA_START=87 /DNA_END=1106 /DNA_ORIENTATION=-